MAEPTLQEVKQAIDESNRLFQNEFKEVNAKIKALEAKGQAVDPLLTERMEKINKALDDFSAINEAFIAMQATVNRLEKAGVPVDSKAAEAQEKELKSFNASARTLAAINARQTPAEVSAEDYKAYKAAFDTYLRRGERTLTDMERRALSVGVDTEGGYLVTSDLSGRIVMRIYETSPMRQYASSQTIATDALEGAVDLDEATVGWVSETGTRSETNTPKVPQPWKIPVHEAYASPKATQKLLEDANIDVAAWLARKVGDKLGRTFNTAFVTGDGAGKPRGFASYTTAATADSSRSWGVFEHIASGSAGSFGTDPNGVQKLIDLIHSLKEVYLGNAAFYMNRTTLGKLRQLTDASSAGKFVFVPSFQAGVPDTVLGYPVRILQDMASYSTTNALAIAFGDMAETYLIVDRLGISTLVDPYTAKPYVVFYTRARVGGDVTNTESLKFLKFGTS